MCKISVTEQLGVEERGDYYDGSGALRDMIQNHLLQLNVPRRNGTPVSFNADEVRDRKVDVLRAMRKFGPEDVRNSTVRGQYGSGWMQGRKCLLIVMNQKLTRNLIPNLCCNQIFCG